MSEELTIEIDRLKRCFPNADENALAACEGLIEQAAYERIFLRRLNAQALESGLVKFHPDNPKLQKSLPVSGEIAKHSAALTNIIDKLIKHLGVIQEDNDDELAEFA